MNAVVLSRPEFSVIRRQTSAELIRWYPGDLLDELRRVPREVPLQHLEHATRMLQSLVGVGAGVGGGTAGAVRLAACGPPQVPADGLAPAVAICVLSIGIGMLAAGRLDFLALVTPGIEVVVPLVGVQAGEHPVQILGIGKLLRHDRGRVGVGDDVLA